MNGYLTVARICEKYFVSDDTVKRFARKHPCSAFKVGRAWLVHEQDFLRYRAQVGDTILSSV